MVVALAWGLMLAAAADAGRSGVAHAVVQPTWDHIDFETLQSLYPKPAARAGAAGVSWIDCHVSPAGALDDCRAVLDRPAGWGFGEAAAKFAVSMTMHPMRVDGTPVDARILTPIAWQVQGHDVWSPPTPADALSAYPADAAAAALSGGAVAECRPTRGGSRRTCSVVTESPEGLGFGEAAEGLAAQIADRWFGIGQLDSVRLEVRWYAEAVVGGYRIRPQAVMRYTDASRILRSPAEPAPAQASCADAPKADAEAIVLACTLALRSNVAGAAAERSGVLAVRAKAQLRRNQGRRALVDLDAALSLTPDRPGLLIDRAAAKASQRDLDGAVADLDRALALEPGSASAWMRRSALMRRKGDYNQAVADASKAVSLTPTDPEALETRSLAYAEKGDLDAAVADLDHALILKPNEGLLFERRGLLQLQRHDPDRAIQDLDRAVSLTPDSVYGWWGRGYAWSMKGDFQKALSDLDRAVALSPEALEARASVREKAGDFAGAIADYDAVVRLHPKRAVAFNGRCWARAIAKGDLDQAQRDCDRAVQIDPNYANAWDSSGFVLYRRRDYARAIAAFDTALGLRPKSAASLYVRGLAKLRSGREAEGRADMAAAAALDPGVAATYAKWGVVP